MAAQGKGIIIVEASYTRKTGHQNNRRYLKVAFADTGPGIPPEIKERVFEPYISTKETGHGLGLAMVHQIVKEHNGFIDVVSEPGFGCCFQIFLPLEE